jgi:hypothetical protein
MMKKTVRLSKRIEEEEEEEEAQASMLFFQSCWQDRRRK